MQSPTFERTPLRAQSPGLPGASARTVCRVGGATLALASSVAVAVCLWGSPSAKRLSPQLPPGESQVTPAALPADVTAQLTTMALPFIANVGQVDARVRFYAPTLGGTVFLTDTGEIVYALSRPAKPHPPQRVLLTETLVGGTVQEVQGLTPALTRVSYFHGADSAHWQSQAPTFARVSLGEVYPGIAVQLVAKGKQVEKFFYLQPGADPGQIRLHLHGGNAYKINAQGELELETALEVVRLSKP